VPNPGLSLLISRRQSGANTHDSRVELRRLKELVTVLCGEVGKV